MNIQPLAFLDTWAFASTLYARYKDRFGGDHHSAEILPLRTAEDALPILAEWKSAKALLSRLRVAAAPLTGGKTAELGAVALVRLKAGGYIDWSREEGEFHSVQLPIVPSPGAWLYSGGEAAVLPVGQLTFVNRKVLYSAVNLGDHPVIHLVTDVREPSADD